MLANVVTMDIGEFEAGWLNSESRFKPSLTLQSVLVRNGVFEQVFSFKIQVNFQSGRFN